jgi:hypothetical protein
MRKLLLVLFLSGFGFASYSQTATLKGKLVDTLEKRQLSNAVVSLINKKDSSLYQFVRSGKDGSFQFSSIDTGKYVLLITYPKFADFADDIELNSGIRDLGSMPLTQKSALLATVIIRSTGPIRIKGDTTEYIADSFAVKEGATVEDLLKKFPGFQVNSRGEITAQGQRVSKVLVDGEEFFGDDPTMATKNISAKAVDKVQVFDTKTDQQNLTGITSGNEGKTVNIKLKEDKKKGYFGKAEAGTDAQDLVDAKALYNNFVGKKKISVYGTKSNTTTGSLNWDEQRQLGIENDYEYDELSGYYFSFGSADEFSNWSLRGLPDSYTAGALYINKWNADKLSLNGSYRYNRLGTTNVGSNLSQTILPDTILFSNRYTNTRGLNQQHAGNIKYEWKKTDNFSDTYSESLQNKDLINKNSRVNNMTSEKTQLDNQLQYKRLFKKKNRQMISTFRFGTIEDDQNGTLYSVLNIYGTNPDVDTIDQVKRNVGKSTTLGGKITFSEPLNDKWSLIAEYSHNENISSSRRESFNKEINGKLRIDSLFSNAFDLDAFSNSGSLIARFTSKKVRFAVGSGISSTQLNLLNLDSNRHSKFNFLNITPQLSFNYPFKPQTNISINYRGTTRQPTIEQLQPIRDNADPLNIYVGNPDLKVGFNHNISFFYNSYKVLTGRGIWLNGGYNFTENAITQYSTIVAGKRTYQPVNVDGNNNWWFWSEWNYGEGEKKFIHTLRFNANGNTFNNFVNAAANKTKSFTSEFAYGIRYEFPEKYSIYVSPEVGYNTSTSSLNKSIKNNFFSYGGRIEGSLTLPGKVEFTTEVNFDLRQKLEAFNTNPNITTWRADLSKKVFKDKSGKFILAANDILNQNIGFNRNINSNFISEDRYQRLSRYFMLRFEWTFNKMPGAK